MGKSKQRKFRKKPAGQSDDEDQRGVGRTQGEEGDQENGDNDGDFYVRRGLRDKRQNAGVVYLGGKAARDPAGANPVRYSEHTLEELRQDTFRMHELKAEADMARTSRHEKREEAQYISLDSRVPDVVRVVGESPSHSSALDSEEEAEQRGWENEMLRRAGRKTEALEDEEQEAAAEINAMELEDSDPTLLREQSDVGNFERSRTKIKDAIKFTNQDIEAQAERLQHAKDQIEQVKNQEHEYVRMGYTAQEKLELFSNMTDYFEDLSEMLSQKMPIAIANQTQALRLWRSRGKQARKYQANSIEVDTFDMGIEYDTQLFTAFREKGGDRDESDLSSELSESSQDEIPAVAGAPKASISTKIVSGFRADAGERERRSQRRASRKASATRGSIEDGFSTSEDENDDDVQDFYTNLRALDREVLLDDVADRYAGLDKALGHFELWLNRFPKVFEEVNGGNLVTRVAREFGILETPGKDWWRIDPVLPWIAAIQDFVEAPVVQGSGRRLRRDLAALVEEIVGDAASLVLPECVNALSAKRARMLGDNLKFLMDTSQELGNVKSVDKVADALLDAFDSTLQLLKVGDELPPDVGINLVRRRFWMVAKCLYCYGITFGGFGKDRKPRHHTFLKSLMGEALLPCFAAYGGCPEDRLKAMSFVLTNCLPDKWPDSSAANLAPVRAALLRLRAEKVSQNSSEYIAAAYRCGIISQA